MDKRYYYHPSMFVTEHVFISLFYSLISISWILPIILNQKFESFQLSIFRISVLITVTFLIASHLVRILFSNLKGTVFVFTNDDIIKKTPGKTVTIPYADINEFKFIRLPFTRGYGIIKSQSNRIHFPFFIDNLNELIEKFEDSLHVWNNAAILKKNDIDQFKYVALVSKYVNEYVFRSIKPLIRVNFFITVTSIIIAFRIWNLPPLEALMWSLYSTVYPLLSYVIIHLLIVLRVSHHIKDVRMKSANSGTIDISRMISYSVIISAMIYLLSGILYNFF